MACAGRSYRERHAMTLLAGIETMRSELLICDFTIKVGSEIFSVHRTVIAACSQYFKAMLSHDMKESREGVVDMKDIPPLGMKKCIQFMYSGEIDLVLRDIECVLHTASFLQLDLLITACFDFVESNLSIESVFFAKEIAQAHAHHKLVKKCEKFIAVNFIEISKTDDFLSLPGEDLKIYLETLEIGLEPLWTALVGWTNHDIDNRERDFGTMLKVVCGKNPRVHLLLLFWKENLVQKSERCRKVICDCLLSDLDRLKENIDFDTCFVLKEFARNCGHNTATILDDEINCFLIDNFVQISRMEGWKFLMKNDISQILHSKDIVCTSEKVKWDALLSWTTHEQRRKRYFHELLKLLDFSLLSCEFIQETVRNEPLIRDSSHCMSLVMDALVLHVQRQNEECVHRVEQAGPREIEDEEVDELARNLERLVEDENAFVVHPPVDDNNQEGSERGAEILNMDEVDVPISSPARAHPWWRYPPPPHHPFHRHGHHPPHHHPPPHHPPPPHCPPPHHRPQHPHHRPPHPHRGGRGRRGWGMHHHHHPPPRNFGPGGGGSYGWGDIMHRIARHHADENRAKRDNADEELFFRD